jgi:hypothetical protein
MGHFNLNRIFNIGFVILFFLGNLFLTSKAQKGEYHNIITDDAQGYYEYLPYLFIEHDITGINYGYQLENGNRLDKYPCGVAMLESPFFYSFHLIEKWKGRKQPIRGNFYGLCVAIAASFYLALGILFLFHYLIKYFKLLIAALSILLVYAGTNLFYYSAYSPGMSHVFSFFCFSGFLFFIDRMFQRPFLKDIIAAALLFGLAVVIRPTNIIIGILYLLYSVYGWNDFKARFVFFKNHRYILPVTLLCCLVVMFPQLWYWHEVTGNWITYSYGVNNESFIYLKTPKIDAVLFGLKAGWITYTPLCLIFFAGLILSGFKRKFHFLAISIIFFSILYLCASWWSYEFLCAFGYRSFVEYWPLFIIPVAAVINTIAGNGNKKGIIVTLILSFILILLNIKMSYRYSYWASCFDGWTWVKYWHEVTRILLFK